jgi:hypothetical protein
MLHIFTSIGDTATFETEDFSDMQAGSHPIPNTEDTSRFTAITQRVLYASYQGEKQVSAFDRETGTKLKNYPYTQLPIFWMTPGALISEGFLYLSINYKDTEVYNLLTGEHITTFTVPRSSETQAFGNRCVYIEGNEVRERRIGGRKLCQ